MNLNPANYFIKRYHSPNLQPNELKKMLNLWLPFILNRIKVISISNDFSNFEVQLKYSFWNRNPSKSIWGGSISSAIDPFFPIMMKQIMLNKGIITDFFSKAIQIKFINKVQSHLLFHFIINTNDILDAHDLITKNGKYEGWHSVEGIDINGQKCVLARIQIYLRKR